MFRSCLLLFEQLSPSAEAVWTELMESRSGAGSASTGFSVHSGEPNVQWEGNGSQVGDVHTIPVLGKWWTPRRSRPASATV